MSEKDFAGTVPRTVPPYLPPTLVCLLCLAGVPLEARQATELSARAFDAPVVLHVTPLATAVETRDALAAALIEIHQIETLTWVEGSDLLVEPAPGGAAALNRRAGVGWVSVDPRLAEVLERALTFCSWSGNAIGPLAGRLYELWGLRRDPRGERPNAPPPPTAVAAAVQAARCDGLQLDRGNGRAALQAGHQIDLWSFARGHAVDRAVEVLRAQGAAGGSVRIGSILRVFGNAPEPDRARVTGWPVAIDPAPDRRAPTERLVLSDRALAMASSWLEPIELGGVAFPPYIDQRAGAPPQRTLTVLVVTELALDAEALAGALFVMSVREGETRLGGLSPPPAVKWLLGRDGPPVVSERRWAALPAWSETPQGP